MKFAREYHKRKQSYCKGEHINPERSSVGLNHGLTLSVYSNTATSSGRNTLRDRWKDRRSMEIEPYDNPTSLVQVFSVLLPGIQSFF
jgi:hypothetical protein